MHGKSFNKEFDSLTTEFTKWKLHYTNSEVDFKRKKRATRLSTFRQTETIIGPFGKYCVENARLHICDSPMLSLGIESPKLE